MSARKLLVFFVFPLLIFLVPIYTSVGQPDYLGIQFTRDIIPGEYYVYSEHFSENFNFTIEFTSYNGPVEFFILNEYQYVLFTGNYHYTPYAYQYGSDALLYFTTPHPNDWYFVFLNSNTAQITVDASIDFSIRFQFPDVPSIYIIVALIVFFSIIVVALAITNKFIWKRRESDQETWEPSAEAYREEADLDESLGEIEVESEYYAKKLRRRKCPACSAANPPLRRVLCPMRDQTLNLTVYL